MLLSFLLIFSVVLLSFALLRTQLMQLNVCVINTWKMARQKGDIIVISNGSSGANSLGHRSKWETRLKCFNELGDLRGLGSGQGKVCDIVICFHLFESFSFTFPMVTASRFRTYALRLAILNNVISMFI
ncbi:hypothetical protein K435DRAFT_802280 [Dendrothele bispora CBS 962.96]|uniref:Secreted protein n=1 Tax=Dendrothele bispora (strain CBS 962.96) TaxID=1314807 RepID=A0A4S8LLK6_DENBC|nr:hypothetical protein K435DRAFT_802280 [Dendrothele bispora CBS 962.96]